MIKQDLTYQEFKKCIQIISGRDITTIMKYPSRYNSIEEIISINGTWFSIGDKNDHTEFSIVKINHECDGSFSIIKSARTFEDCLYKMAEYKEFLKNQ
tara:strand:- start:1253 stop:1546 length:294 start_codon:yes stop_codon:yes gene_type:complete